MIVPDVTFAAHRSGVYFEDVSSSFQIGQPKLNSSVQPSWASERWVQCVRSVRCHQHFDISWNSGLHLALSQTGIMDTYILEIFGSKLNRDSRNI